MILRFRFLLVRALVAGTAITTALGQTTPSAAPSAAPMRKASELIQKQEPLNVSVRLLDKITPETAHLLVSLGKQRAYLMLEDEIVIDTPISSGKRAGMTPTGHFTILEKEKDHHSNVYGDFRDRAGRTVRSGVSVRIDSAPSGTHFEGAAMKWFMRLTDDGVGMHVGILPGYAASHGCVRLPSKAAELIYANVKVGTPVEVTD